MRHRSGLRNRALGSRRWVVAAPVAVAVTTMLVADVHGRIILDTDWVPSPGGEAATAMDSITPIAGDTPGLQGVIYDGALRGVHHQRLLRDLGILSVNRSLPRLAPALDARDASASRSRPSLSSAPSPMRTAPIAPSTCSPEPARSASAP